MLFRATAFAINSQAIEYARQFTVRIANYHKQISSGVRLHRPSDDPIAFRQATSLTARLDALKADAFALSDSQSKLNISVSQLTEANQILTTAKVLTQQGIQALSPSERNALATEVESLLQRLQDIALTTSHGDYLYGGTRADTPPYSFAEPTVVGGTLHVQYHGAAQASRAFLGQSVAVDTLYPGPQIFGAQTRGTTLLIGQTGAQVGQGTDNMIGRATLQVRHTATTFAPGSGSAPGLSSPGNDTIIGGPGTHQVRIIDLSGDGSSGTISLNDGPPVTFTNTDTNLEVAGPNGQRLFVNTTSIVPGFDGTIEVLADGTLSVDGGLTTAPIDFSNSQTLTDSTTGRFVHIDSTAIVLTGDDYLEFPGTSDVFQVLHELIQDLRGARELSNTDWAASMDRRLGALQAASHQVLDVVGQQSASLASLRQLESQMLNLELETEERLIQVQATDVAEAVLRMKNDQTLLEHTYAITAQFASLQLLNFLR